MKRFISIIVSVIALASPILGHANASNDVNCLAQNIYHEAANEPEEGKVAVGLVTINRANHDRFPKTICGVVNQRTVRSVPRTVTVTKESRDHRYNKTKETHTRTVWQQVSICQFSWKCESGKYVKVNDRRWSESLRIATELLDGGYDELRSKYNDAMYFHEYRIRPSWAIQKRRIEKIGGHIFYADA
jgi:N-acetylmuramoyl-L-alanine amidase